MSQNKNKSFINVRSAFWENNVTILFLYSAPTHLISRESTVHLHVTDATKCPEAQLETPAPTPLFANLKTASSSSPAIHSAMKQNYNTTKSHEIERESQYTVKFQQVKSFILCCKFTQCLAIGKVY